MPAKRCRSPKKPDEAPAPPRGKRPRTAALRRVCGPPTRSHSGALLNGLVQVGRFWFKGGTLHPRQEMRLREICAYFSDEVTRRLLVPVATQEYAVSLRLLDYTMTNWAKKTRYMTLLNTAHGPSPLNIFSLYKDWLRYYRRRGFDPFRRRERIFFLQPSDGSVLDTTVAQLNFLRWADLYGIMTYVQANKDQIEGDMMQTLSESKKRRLQSQEGEDPEPAAAKRRKRVELSRAPMAKCVIYPIQQNVHFETVEESA